MSVIQVLPEMTAPTVGVVCGFLLVYVGLVAWGAVFAVLSLATYAYVN
jgi:hypothetical protein